MKEYQKEIGVEMVPFKVMVYVEELNSYYPDDEVPEGNRAVNILGKELRKRLADGSEIPPWFTFPEIAEELRKTHPPRHRQGFTVFFTGLSGAGKSTIAKALLARFLEAGGRPVTLLDGDIVRKHLSSELGFSKEHDDADITIDTTDVSPEEAVQQIILHYITGRIHFRKVETVAGRNRSNSGCPLI